MLLWLLSRGWDSHISLGFQLQVQTRPAQKNINHYIFTIYKNIIDLTIMRRRQIKKTVISYQQTPQKKQVQRQRSRSKEKARVQVVDAGSRRARLAQLKSRRNDEQITVNSVQQQININSNLQKNIVDNDNSQVQKPKPEIQQKEVKQEINKEIKQNQLQNQQQNSSQNQNPRVLLKPIYISKQNRQQDIHNQKDRQGQRKKKALRYTTKLLLLQNAKDQRQSDQQLVNSSDEQLQTNMPDDDDTKNQEYQYELWKIRQLKRIRRDKQQRRKIQKQKAEIQRRRKMNNQQILLQNKVMGSDANDHNTQTKYVYMQKYYHKGAFYQDSQDPIFKRDFNLPTPLQMQDKSMLPQILQKRKGDFGKKGQSKYKHLTAEDTTNFDPLTRPDQSILNSWKKKMAGYKGYGNSNI